MEIINLEISHEIDYLKFSFNISTYTKLPIKPYTNSLKFSEKDLTNIQKYCQNKIDYFNQKIQKGVDKPKLLEEFNSFGLKLGSDLLDRRIKAKLKKQSIGDYLLLSLDDDLLPIPWELIVLNNLFLCRQFNMGRIVTPNEDSVNTYDENNFRKISRPLNMFIIANPGNDLESAENEGIDIIEVVDGINPDKGSIIVDPTLEPDISVEKALSEISKSHIVHFAGHAEYDVANPNARRWKLASDYLTSSDIDKIAGSTKMPVLVVSNACQSGCADKWTLTNDISVDLVHAFLRAGVRCYIGTLCKIVDLPSSYFAKQFYQFIVEGKSVGEAIRLSRESFIEKYGEFSVGWATYIVYGDPTLCLFDHQKNVRVEHDDPIINQAENIDFRLFKKVKTHISKNSDPTHIRTPSESNQPVQNSLQFKAREPSCEKQPIDSILPDNRSNAKKNVNKTCWIISFLLFVLFIMYWLIIAFEMYLAVKKETETADLITRLNQILPPERTEQNNQFLNIAFDFSDLQFIFFGIDTGITSDIINNIKSKESAYYQKNIIFLEREFLNTILNELILTGHSTANLYITRLFLYLDFRWHFFQSIIHTRLLDVETGERIELKDYPLEDRSIKNRKKIANQITEELLKKLTDYNYLN